MNTHAPPEAESPLDARAGVGQLELMRDLFSRLGDIYRGYLPRRRQHVYVIHHPDDVKRVLVLNHANYAKGHGVDRVKTLLGNGLITSEGEFWRSHRYMMQPMFHRRVVNQLSDVIAAAVDRLLERWEGLEARRELIDVSAEMSEFALDVMLRAIFGGDLDRLAGQAGNNPFEFIAKEIGRGAQFASKLYKLREVVVRLVRDRCSNTSERLDFMGMLMGARDKATGASMSERELIDEVMTLIIAGHDTTASGLTSAWYLLSQHPEAEEQMHAEIDSLPSQTAPDFEASESMVYTRSVVDEALRLYPPVWLLTRRAIGPDVLAGYEIPAGANVFMSPYLVHRHPKFWVDPDTFNPSRATSASGRDPNSQQFARIPFAAGPRRCIGETLALYEMCVHFHRVARRYRLTQPPAQHPELEALINLRIVSPVLMRLERR
jgi:cytochrome P450